MNVIFIKTSELDEYGYAVKADELLIRFPEQFDREDLIKLMVRKGYKLSWVGEDTQRVSMDFEHIVDEDVIVTAIIYKESSEDVLNDFLSVDIT